MKNNLLPHYWKKIALGIFSLGIAVWIVNTANPQLFGIDPFIRSMIVKSVILVSFLLFVSSKEKVEAERYDRLRLNSLFGAVTAGGFFLVFEFFMEVLFEGEKTELTDGYELMMLVLVVYSLSFYIKRNIKTVSRG